MVSNPLNKDHVTEYDRCPVCMSGRRSQEFLEAGASIFGGRLQIMKSMFECGTTVTARIYGKKYDSVEWRWCGKPMSAIVAS